MMNILFILENIFFDILIIGYYHQYISTVISKCSKVLSQYLDTEKLFELCQYKFFKPFKNICIAILFYFYFRYSITPLQIHINILYFGHHQT